MADEWVSPTSHSDLSFGWDDETNAYDENTGTRSRASKKSLINGGYISDEWLELLHATLWCSKVRAFGVLGFCTNIHIDVWYGDAWHTIATNTPISGWTEVSLGGTYSVTKARIKVQTVAAYVPNMYEFYFWETTEPAVAGRSFGFIMG